jgi:hypothetical protein
MGKDAKADLPQFSDAKTYLLRGKTLNRLMEAIRRNRPIAGKGTTIRETADGRQIESEAILKLPKHPWQLYPNEGAWSVFPAGVNLVHEPAIGGVLLANVPPPVLIPDGSGNLEAWLSFDLDATSSVGIGGVYRLTSGSQVLSNVEVGDTDTGTTEVSVDEGTGVVTPGHYSVQIGAVVAGKVTAQYLRFSIHFNLCGGGGLSPSAYG